jgi:hypothetical protein
MWIWAKRYTVLVTLVGVCPALLLSFDTTITLPIVSYLTDADVKAAQNKWQSHLQKTGTLARLIAKSYRPLLNQGVLATYGGYIRVSDFNGLLQFPRIQQKAEFHILITPFIEPVMMIGNTVHHWEIPLNAEYAYYKCILTTDAKTGLKFWKTEEAELPKKRIIPLDTITIFGKPKRFLLPLGATVTRSVTQLVLPPLYAVKMPEGIIPALRVLKVRQFFGPLNDAFKQISPTYRATNMTTTM